MKDNYEEIESLGDEIPTLKRGRKTADFYIVELKHLH